MSENQQQPSPTDDTERAGQNASAQVDFAALQQKIQELEAQVKEKEQKYLYLYAEFENFKKRSFKERQDLVKFGWESVARDLLQVVDNLERAVLHMPSTTDKNLRAGIEMVLNQFQSALSHQGVQTIDTARKEFDPNLHEAVAQEASEQAPGTIVSEHGRGYTLHGRLLRPARVVVSSGPGTAK